MPRIPDMLALFDGLPDWVGQLLVSIAIAYAVCVFGVVFGRMGKSPYWGLVFVLPFIGTIVLWTFGLGKWPQEKGNQDLESGL